MGDKTVSRIGLLLGAGLILTLALYEVHVDPQFDLPQERQQADPAQEARFDECFAQRDAGIHEAAFATIDNPDVQREFIATERDKARAACRKQFPQRLQTIQRPFRFNLVDLRFRY